MPAVGEQHTVIAPAAAAGEHDAAAPDAIVADAAAAEPAPARDGGDARRRPRAAAAVAVRPRNVPQPPGFRERGRMRRRLRYLREIRELGYRDLGGLVFDQHRFGRPNEALVQGKVSRSTRSTASRAR